MESSNFSKVKKVFDMLQKSRFKKKVVVNKAATHALRQEHSAGCLYVCIKLFVRLLASVSGIKAFIEYSSKIS